MNKKLLFAVFLALDDESGFVLLCSCVWIFYDNDDAASTYVGICRDVFLRENAKVFLFGKPVISISTASLIC